ncbi:MAG: type II toxin-antitoxin system VapC family toxin [Pseudomonadota bacterium]
MKLYLDTNVYIEAFERNSTKSALLSDLIIDSARFDCSITASELVLTELLVKPIRDEDHRLVATYYALMHELDWIDVRPVSSPTLLFAATLRATNDALKLPDAIHLAEAARADCANFITIEKRLSSLQWDKAWLALQMTGQPPTVTNMTDSNLDFVLGRA